MKKLDEILEEWSNDSIIDPTKLLEASLQTQTLHSKYLKYYSNAKSLSTKFKIQFDEMKNIRTEYYLGQLDKETLDQYGWEPFDIRISTKAGVERYIESDKLLNSLRDKKLYYEQIIEVCQYILTSIKSRTWDIKANIDYQKFLSGSF